MRCPNCAILLTSEDLFGIEIDSCPTCQGVWLDRGELNQILERSAECSLPEAELNGAELNGAELNGAEPAVSVTLPELPPSRLQAGQSYWLTVLNAD